MTIITFNTHESAEKYFQEFRESGYLVDIEYDITSPASIPFIKCLYPENAVRAKLDGWGVNYNAVSTV